MRRKIDCKMIAIFPLYKLHDIAKIVAMHIQMSLGAGDGQALGRRPARNKTDTTL